MEVNHHTIRKFARICTAELKDREDLKDFTERLPGFLQTAQANEKNLVIEVWVEKPEPSQVF